MIQIMNNINIFMQTAGNPLETEHALVMLLLLYGLLTFGDRIHKWIPLAVVLTGVLLAVFTPVHQIDLFWPLITGLIVPPFLWEAAVAVTKSGKLRNMRRLVIWGISLLLISASLYIFSALPISNALLLGMLTVTLIWYFRELKTERSYLSTLGLIALAVLLVEVDLAVVSLEYWIGTLFSGVAIGFVLGFVGIFIYRRVNWWKYKNIFFLLWAYLVYLVGLVMEISGIATTLAAALIVATYGYSIGLWYRQKDIPVPSNSLVFFYLSASVWITLGWQAHATVDSISFVGLIETLIIISILIFAIRKLSANPTGANWIRLLRKELSVLMLLVGSLLLWPREAFLTTLSVEIALAAALLLIIVLRETINPIFEFIGTQLSWPSEDE